MHAGSATSVSELTAIGVDALATAMQSTAVAAGGAKYPSTSAISVCADEVRPITAEWIERYNQIRPHDALPSLSMLGTRSRWKAYHWS